MIPRIIPRLDIKGPNVVKGIHLEGLRVISQPLEMAKMYCEEGADEIFYQDVVATLYERNSLHKIIEETASEIFVPLCVGGGLRTTEDIYKVLRSGADKVAINTAAVRNPDIINNASREYGSSTIVVTIEAVKVAGGSYTVLTDNGREETGLEVGAWTREITDRGAGEIVCTSIDREGTGIGYDHELAKLVLDNTTVPVIVHGGAGCAAHVKELFEKTEANAVAIASLFHYEYLRRGYGSVSSEEGNNSSKIGNRTSVAIPAPSSIGALKESLVNNGISCRVI